MKEMGNRAGNRKTGPALVLFFLLAGLFSLLLLLEISRLPVGQNGLGEAIRSLQGESPITSQVTAVLLNFRGYDTMLEVIVLLLAVIGVWSITPALPPGKNLPLSPVQTAVVRLLIPLMLLIGFYFACQGTTSAGGAFQGGAVLGGAGVLLLITEFPFFSLNRPQSSLVLRLGLILGPALFLLISVYCLLAGGNLLEYPPDLLKTILLLIEIVCAVSIGLTLTCLFAGGRPKGDLSYIGPGGETK